MSQSKTSAIGLQSALSPPHVRPPSGILLRSSDYDTISGIARGSRKNMGFFTFKQKIEKEGRTHPTLSKDSFSSLDRRQLLLILLTA